MLKKNGAERVSKISVRLGTESVVFRSLYFCFESAAAGTLCDGAILDIDEVPLSAYCPACDEAKALASRTSFRCPDCGTPTPKILTGREMQLVSLSLEYPGDVRAMPPAEMSHPSISGESHE
jgi:hydrogenase nickel incorporation protein HypA/HybF